MVSAFLPSTLVWIVVFVSCALASATEQPSANTVAAKNRFMHASSSNSSNGTDACCWPISSAEEVLGQRNETDVRPVMSTDSTGGFSTLCDAKSSACG